MNDLLNFRIIENDVMEVLPFMSIDTVDFLDKTVTNEMDIFEWGSGGSTIYFSSRVKKNYSSRAR